MRARYGVKDEPAAPDPTETQDDPAEAMRLLEEHLGPLDTLADWRPRANGTWVDRISGEVADRKP